MLFRSMTKKELKNLIKETITELMVKKLNNVKEHFDPDEHERQKRERDISKFNKRNPSRFPCPTCGKQDALSSWEKKQGYQCKACADAEEGNY